MADDQISVELLAKIDGLTSGLTEAVTAMREAVESMKGDVHGLEETAKESESTLEKMLSMETFEFAKERVTEALESIKEAFESTAVKAEEFSLSNAKFAVMMGTSETQAAGLSAALRGVGSSSEEYEGMALKLEMRLKTMEPAMNQMGVTTRDANGQLLGGKDLMDSAISAMQSYKAGTDQNSFALEVFGRRAADVYDLMRVSNEDVEHQIDLYKEMGVTLEGTGSDAQEFESGMNDLRTILDALEIKVGQKLMPVIEAALNWLGHNGSALLQELEKAVEDATGSLIKMTKEFVGLVESAGKAYAWLDKMGELTDKLEDPRNEHTSETLKEIWGMFEKIGQSADEQSGHVDSLTASWDSLKEAITGAVNAADYGDHGESLGMNYEAPNPYKKAGGGKSFQSPGKGGKEKAPSAEYIQDDEKLAEERLALEASTDQHLAAMGQETAEQLAAQKRDLENRGYQVKLDALNRELALSGRTVEQTAHLNAQIEELGVAHKGAMDKIDQDQATQDAAIAKAKLANALRADDEQLKSERANLQERSALGQITVAERDAQEIQLTQSIRREQLARIDAELATLHQGTPAYLAVVKEREKIEKQFTADMKSENAQRAKDIEANVKQWVTPLTSGFKTAISDMVLHGKSFADAMKSIGDTILQGFLDMVLQMAEHWAILQITNAAIGESTQASLGVAQVTSNAAVAASGAAASVAAIPLIGPALAAGAAAETFGLVMGYAPIAAAEGGMVLDKNQLVYAHAKEMILPAPISQGLQKMIASGSGGGDVNIHYNPQVSGGNKDLSALIREQPGALRAAISQLSRDGAFRPRIA